MKTPWLKSAPVLALNVLLLWPAYMLMVGVLWAVGLPLIWWAAVKGHYHLAESKVFAGKARPWPRSIETWGKEPYDCYECGTVRKSRFLWMRAIWGNEQDGIDGLAFDSSLPYEDRYAGSLSWWPSKQFKSHAARIFQWSALRNSTNNLRFMHYFVPWLGWINPKTIKPAKIRWSGTEAPLDAVLATEVRDVRLQGAPLPVWGLRPVRRFACLLVRQGLYAGLRIAVRFRGRAHRIWFGWKLNPGMAVEGWWPDDPCWKGVGFTCGQVRRST